MKIKNITKNTIYIEDIDKHIPYENKGIYKISADILKKSKSLRNFIINKMFDVVEYDPNERIEASIMYLRSKNLCIKPEPEPEPEPAILSTIDDIEVKMNGIFYDASGYAKVNRNLANKLNQAGVKVKIIPKRSQNQLKESELKNTIHLTKTNLSKNHISIDSIIPSFAEYSTGKYHVLYTTIESYTIPKQFLQCCQIYDEIWVTSPFAKKILKTEVNKPIYVIPAGVDSNLYTEHGDRFDFKPNIKNFVFISVFAWGYRKGYDVLLKSYFDEFDASDNVSLLIFSRYQGGITRFHKNKIKDDINEIMRQFPNKDMPHVVRFSQTIPEQQMPQLYRSADCFVLPSRGEGSCNLPGTKIVTNRGLLDIESVVNNEYVLTHSGKFFPVIKTMHRFVEEHIYHIYTKMNGQSPICMTGEHPVLTLSRQKTLRNGKKNLNEFKLSNCEWKEVYNLSCSDYVVFPIDFACRKNLEVIYTKNYFRQSSVILKNEMIYRVSNAKSQYVHNHPNCSPIPDKIKLNEDFLRFLGLYIAKGWCRYNTNKNKGCVSFSFHSKEIEYHDIVRQTMKNIFNQKLKNTNYNQDERKYRYTLVCNNTLCSELFYNLCGIGSHNKHLPDFSWQLSKRQRLALIRGIFEGNGCFYNDPSSPSLSLSSVSEQLIDEVMLLLRSVGINGFKQTKKNSGYLVSIKGEQLNELNFIKSAVYKTNKRKTMVSVKNKNYIFLPITNIEKHRYAGMVYNLEVKHDNSYVTNFIVHNCLPPVEASLCGLPVIMTNASGQQMYLRKDNSYPIEIDDLVKIRTGQMHIHFWDGQKFPALTSKKVHDELKHTMRYVSNNIHEAKKRNKKLQKLIKEQFTWNNTANAAIKRLQEIKAKW